MLGVCMGLLTKSKSTLPFILGALAVAFFGWKYHQFAIEKLTMSHKEALQLQVGSLQAECTKDKLLTEGVSLEYQKTISDLSTRVGKLKRLSKTRCIPVSVPEPTAGRDITEGNKGLPKAYGITGESLYQYAADAETVGLKFDACKAFVTKVWAAKTKLPP